MANFQPTALLPETRADLEALIEAAIERLDDIDGDPDLEEEPDEPNGDEADYGATDDEWSGYGQTTSSEDSRATFKRAKRAVDDLRKIMIRRGLKPVGRLRPA